MPDSTVQTPEEAELANLMVVTLSLEMSVDDIDPLSPLFRDGLGLDSIDILELALAISKTYGVQLRADDADNETTFRSLRDLNEHIRRRRPA
jgi:acyl carrier protein